MSAAAKENLSVNLEKLGQFNIKKWLFDIKTTQGLIIKDNKIYVKNPTTDREIDTTTHNMNSTYPLIIKWCLNKYYLEGYDFSGIPNINEIATSIGITISSNSPAARGNTMPLPPPPAAAQAASAPPPPSSLPITTILEKWRNNPKIHPETGKPLEVLINPESQYAKLYKEYIKMLVADVLLKKQGSSSPNKDRLSIKDCCYIKECMPIAHTKAIIKDVAHNAIDTICYDHLFIKYFVSLQDESNAYVYKYDIYYRNKADIYLYLIVYDTFVRNAPKANDKVSIKEYNSFNTTVSLITSKYCLIGKENEIGIFVNNMCIDIKNILYMHESRITAENINAANYNKEVLKYMLTLSHIKYINTRHTRFPFYNDSLRDELHRYVLRTYPNNDQNDGSHDPINNLYYIYNKILEHTRDANCVIPRALLAVYDSILKLYSDNNMKNNIYKKVYDEYKTIPIFEPPIPRREKLIMDLQKYKAVKVYNAHPEKDEFLAGDDEKWRIQLKNYDKDRKRLKKERAQDIFDRIYEGKVSPKLSPKHKKWKGDNLPTHKKAYRSASSPKKLLQNRYQKYSPIQKPLNAVPPRVSFLKYSRVLKAFALTPSENDSGSGSGKKPKDYYNNDADPYTQEEFKDMRSYKRKHTSDIVHRANGKDDTVKEFHWRYDTVSLYNTIIDSIRDCKRPVNIAVDRDTLLTPENLDEVCRKIKKFTKEPTYASSNEIEAVLANCKYDNCLELSFKEEKDWQRIRRIHNYGSYYSIVGTIKIYLYIKLGGILFRAINKTNVNDEYPDQTDRNNSLVLTLPLLNNELKHLYIDNDEYTFPDHILMDMQLKLLKGGLIGDKYFPNRKNNDTGEQWKKVVTIEDFDLKIDDDGDVVFEKLKKYREYIALL
jgi:hypothetical protein